MKTIFSRDWKLRQLPHSAVANEWLSPGECGIKIYPADPARDWQETRIIFYFKESAQQEPIKIATDLKSDGRLIDATEQNVSAQRVIAREHKHLEKLERYFYAFESVSNQDEERGHDDEQPERGEQDHGVHPMAHHGLQAPV